MKKITFVSAIFAMLMIAACEPEEPLTPEPEKPDTEKPDTSGINTPDVPDTPQVPEDNTLTVGRAIVSFVGEPWEGWEASTETQFDAASVFVFQTAEDLAESNYPEDGNAYAISSYYPTDYASYDFTGYFTSPAYDIPKPGAVMTLKWAYRYGPEDGVVVEVKGEDGEWEKVEMPVAALNQHGPQFAGYADLSEYAGQKVNIRLKYYGLVENTGTWYISDFELLPAYVYNAADGAPEGWEIENTLPPPTDIMDEGVSCGDSDGSSVWFYRKSDGWQDIAPASQYTFAAMAYSWWAWDADATVYFPEIKLNGDDATVYVEYLDNYMGEGQVMLVDDSAKVYGTFLHLGEWTENSQSFNIIEAVGSKATLGIRYTASEFYPCGTFCIKKLMIISK